MAKKKNANGQGYIRMKPNGLWEAQYSVSDINGKRKRKSVYAKSEKEVVKLLNQKLCEINNGTYIPNDKMTVAQWCDIWLKDHLSGVKSSTVNSYECQIRTRIKPALGSIKLQKLTPQHVQSFVRNCQIEQKRTENGKTITIKALSPKSVKNIYGVLHELLDKAVAFHHISTNPCTAISLPRIEKKEMKVIENDSMPAFLKAIKGDRLENLYFVDVFTGMRQAEIIGLKWDYVDFDTETIKVEKQLRRDHSRAGEKYEFTSLKNGKSRVIKPAPVVFEALKRERTKQAQNRLKYGSSFVNKDNLVFTNEIGGHLTGITVYKHLKTILKRIGLDDVRFHDLRHTYATISLQNNDNIKIVSENLGHSTVGFTMQTYAHVTEEMKKESSNNMQQYIERMSV